MNRSYWTTRSVDFGCALRSVVKAWMFVFFLSVAGAQPVITEFMASNDETLADEDGEFEDWVEIHNPGAAAISLSGWFLTDKADNLTKWMFPPVSVPAGGYLVVFTSGKDRIDPGANLHTNFSLSAGGEYLGLVQPDGVTVVSEYAPEFPPQVTDVSYGIASGGNGQPGYLANPTPGSANGGAQDIVLEESVTFDTGSTTFVGSIQVSLTGASDGQVIRYTISPPSEVGGDVPDPTADSPAYLGPLTITESSVVNAAVFSANGKSHGVITTIQLLELDGDGGTAMQSFTSTMPVVVMDNHGYGPMNRRGERSGERVGWIYTFEPGVDGLTRLANGADASSLVDMAVRGQSSSLYPKQGFKFDMRNDWGKKTPFNFLGLGAFDEWNIVAPYQWDTAFIRNAYAYGVSNAMGRWAARTRLAEAFLNQGTDGLTYDDYHGVVFVADKTDVEPGRIDLVELDSEDNEGEAVTGGYLLLIDEVDEDKYHWKTERGYPSTFDSVLQVDTPKIDDLSEAQRDFIVDYTQRLEDALYADEAAGWARRRYLEYVDRGSWVDHHLLNVLFKNPDAFWRSAYLQKDRGQRMVAGPIWDFDRTFESADPRDDEWNKWSPKEFTTQGIAIDYWDLGWWGVLAQDPDFMQAWVDRWQSLRATGPLRHEALVQRMNDYRALVSTDAAARDAAKWPENVSRYGSFAAELDGMETWLTYRAGWIDLQFPARPSVSQNGDGSITLTPPDGTQVIYTLTGADPRMRGGRRAPDAIVVSGPVTLPAGALYRARTYDENRTNFPTSKWSGAIPGTVGAPYAPHPRLSNLSTRTALKAGDDVVIGGFVVEETDGKTVLIRGVGPTLANWGVDDPLADPVIKIFNQDGELVATNERWEDDASADRLPELAAQLGAFPLLEGSADAATIATLPAGNYSVHLRSATGQAGTALLEIYEENDIGSVLNLSMRGTAEGDDNPLVAGFVVTGSEPKRLLIRAVGPTIGDYGVEGVLENPRLVFRRLNEMVAENDDWADAPNKDAIVEASAYVGAFELAEGTRDSVLLVTVEPGLYSASVFGEGGASGAALVEVYEIR